jgi:hypothetical protein
MPKWVVALALLTGCGPGIHYSHGCHSYPPGALGGVLAVLDLTRAVAEVGVAVSALANHPPREPAPAPPPDSRGMAGPLQGSVLWQGRAGDGIPGVRVMLGDDSGVLSEAITDRAGQFQLPVRVLEGEYRLWIDDDSLRGHTRVTLGRGPVPGLMLAARERVRRGPPGYLLPGPP